MIVVVPEADLVEHLPIWRLVPNVNRHQPLGRTDEGRQTRPPHLNLPQLQLLQQWRGTRRPIGRHKWRQGRGLSF
jgi:hypothetical protein